MSRGKDDRRELWANPKKDQRGISRLETYRKHVAERAAEGVVAKPLDAEQVAALVELIKNPPAGEQDFLKELLSSRIPRC